jgi:uncharacterized protein (DUF58 family)
MAQGYEAPLRIAARKHDLVGIHLYDPREEELPNVGLLRAVDAESGEPRWVDTSSRRVREQYARWFQENQAYFQQQFRRSGASTMSVRTTEPYVNALHRFFQSRS